MEADARLGAGSIRRQCRSGGDPEGEVAARGVADAGDPGEVERRIDCIQVIRRGRDVEERLGPPAARADAAVLEVPGRDAGRCEVEGEIGHQRAVVPRPPVAAVHDDHDRVRAGTLWQEQLADLASVLAVAVQRA
jgi:hypothetical protein